MTIDVTKPIRLCNDPNVKFEYIGRTSTGKHVVYNLTNVGSSSFSDNEFNLYFENIPEPRYLWINVYENYYGYAYSTKDKADASALAGQSRQLLRINLDTLECVEAK